MYVKERANQGKRMTKQKGSGLYDDDDYDGVLF